MMAPYSQRPAPMPRAVPRRRPHRTLINGALFAAAALLLVGIFAPLLTLKQLLIFSDTISLASALRVLVEEGYLALFALVLSFSVLFPIAKLVCLFYLWNIRGYGSPRMHRVSQWLTWLGKWSMLDVFVVALLVVSIKLQLIVDAEVRFGLYAFGASVLLTTLIAGPITRRQRPEHAGAGSGSR